MDAVTLLQFIAGLVFLILGAELLVRGSSRLAASFGVSPLVIGLTVVGFGTSAPELAVCLDAALTGNADIALGNVVGSNIFNVLFILGVSALIAPLWVSQRLVRLDVPLMIGGSLLLVGMALDGKVGRLEGGLLFAGILTYLGLCIRLSRAETDSVKEEYALAYGPRKPASMAQRARLVVLVLVGLVLLVLGARWLVAGAVSLARVLGLSELIIGLTIVAAGTSLPEVATSVTASFRGERDIAVGNVVGSNLFNILAVLGIAALVSPQGVEVSRAALRFDLPVMTAVAVACLPIFFTGNRISRWEGALFLGYYVAYMAYLTLDATQHDALPGFSTTMAAFVLPLTIVTLLVLVVRSVRERRSVPGKERQT